jgi:hypothetical protein
MEKSTSSSLLLRLVSTAAGDSEAAGRFPSAPREAASARLRLDSPNGPGFTPR